VNWRYQAARQSMAQDEMSSEPRPVPMNNSDDDQAKIQSYEEAFRQIKEATGVSDTQASVLVAFLLQWINLIVHSCTVIDVYTVTLVHVIFECLI